MYLTAATDGNWEQWGAWGACDTVKGEHTRTRTCTKPAPANGGKQCETIRKGDKDVKMCTAASKLYATIAIKRLLFALC